MIKTKFALFLATTALFYSTAYSQTTVEQGGGRGGLKIASVIEFLKENNKPQNQEEAQKLIEFIAYCTQPENKSNCIEELGQDGSEFELNIYISMARKSLSHQ